ncbi:hypothetical protein ABIE65_004280 [Constrictibacter sp. MBR-5]|jgi:hypothetical protein|uniref:hypothetical protein n=1 Tax=Constrictibacter sp. MBR-5 TaxID=3156467 RepID=UPI0033984E1C
MNALLQDPIVRGVGLPFVAALIVALAGRMAGATASRHAALGVPLAFLATYILLLGWPPFPPVSAAQKISYGVAGLALAGLLADGRLGRPWALALAGGAALAAALGWLALRPLSTGSTAALTLGGAVLAGGTAAFLALARERARPAVAGAALTAAALGLGGIALTGASASIAQAAIALAAAAGGFAVATWFRPLVPLGAAGIIGGAGALALLAGQAAFFTRLDRTALALLAASIPMLLIVGRLRAGRGPGLLAPVVAGLAAGIPAAAAVGYVTFLK